MYRSALVLLLSIAAPALPAEPAPPLASGHYTFQQRFAEHPGMPGIRVDVEIRGTHVVVENPVASTAFPAGVITEGELQWHAASAQWIIAHDASDRLAQEVGGCSDGPEVIDLAARVYWTC